MLQRSFKFAKLISGRFRFLLLQSECSHCFLAFRSTWYQYLQSQKVSQHPSGLVPPSALFIPSLYISFETLLCQCLPQFLQKKKQKTKGFPWLHTFYHLFFSSPSPPGYTSPCASGCHHKHHKRHQYPFVDKPKDLSFFLLLCLILRLLPSSYWNYFPSWLPGPKYSSSSSVFWGQISFANSFQKVIVLPSIVLSAFFSPCPLSWSILTTRPLTLFPFTC